MPLTQVETEALNIIDSIVHEPAMRLDMMLEPGEIQFASNYVVMYSKTRFVDGDNPVRHHKKLRLWL